MSEKLKLPTCGKCGAALSGYAPDGLCAACLLDSAFEERDVQFGDPAKPAPLFAFKDYELLEEIARGGMGVVYRARQISLNRLVAIKMILGGHLANAAEMQRFRVEAETAAQLQHPNIVAIHEVGEHAGQPFFSMDFVAGRSLAQCVHDGPLPARKAATYLRTIAEAVQYAHSCSVLHRDLKPSNILIDDADQPRVTDFGLAKRLTSTQDSGLQTQDLTQTGQVLGSPSFIPPEQAAGQRDKIGPSSDVYSLGAMLYHCLTARPPFMAETLTQTLRMVAENDAVSPRLLNPSVPRDLETICLKCLEKDPQRRYATAQELADELGRHLRDEPIHARPIGSTARLGRWCRRKPALAAAIALLLVVAIGSPIAALRINRERVRAEENAVKATKEKEYARQLLYATDISLAQHSLKDNNIGRVRRLLDRHRPQPGEEDLRGWEWRYLWQLTRSSALVTLAHRSTRGLSVSFSPDGTRLAVGWWDGRVDLWDVQGRCCVRSLTDHEYPHPGRVAFSPVRSLLAATSEPKVVTLYDLDSGRESILWRAPDQGRWHVRDLAFSQDGSRVVVYAGSTPELGDGVWVVNASTSQVESHHSTVYSYSSFNGAARLSPDNRRLYLARSDYSNYRYNIECIELATGQELWQTERERDFGLTTLAISPDGRVLASGSGFEDPTIRVWDSSTGRLLVRLHGHTSWVGKLAFTKDGRGLISAAADQSIRFWDTSNWTERKVLRGHTDEVHAIAISETAQLIASAGKDGNLMLWKEDGNSAADGYRRLPEDLQEDKVLPLDHSRVLLLPPGKPPELVDLKRDSFHQTLQEIGSSTNVLGCFSTNIFCYWNRTNKILVRDLRREQFITHGAISLDSGMCPSGFAYSSARQLLAWTEGTSSISVYLESLAAPGRRIELKSDIPGLLPFRFSGDGNYLTALSKGRNSLRAWNVETGQIVASVSGLIRDATFAAGDRVLVVAVEKGNDHEIGFYDLANPDRAPRLVPGRNYSWSLAASTAGGLVASATHGGQVRLFDPAKGELIESVHGHLNAVFGIAFSEDGRRLISTSGGREAVKLWDVGTRQELLTLGGTGSFLQAARWSADGDAILAGAPWQAWSAPSWEEIEKSEAIDDKFKTP